MNLLITGAGGQLGKEWINFCEEHNISYSGYSSSELDITNTKELSRKLEDSNPDVVINCAAYTKVDDAEENESLAFEINSDAIKNLAEICRDRNIKLVHFSTDYVFAGTLEDKANLADGYPENHQRAPVNSYGSSKFFGEKAIEESGCNYLLIRVSWLCGRFGNNFVKTMLRLGKERDELSVVNDQYGSPSFTESVVKEVYQLLKKEQSGTFHSTSNGIISWFDFAKEVFKLKGVDVQIKAVNSSEFPTKAKRPSFSKLSTKKISKIEGIELVDWKVGLKNLLEYVE